MNALLAVFGSALLYLAISLGLIVIGGTLQAFQNWLRRPRRPLAERNEARASIGAGLLVLAVALWAHGLPALLQPIVGVYLLPGLTGFGALFLVIGVLGARGTTRDWMQVIYFGAAAVGCAAALLFFAR